MVIKVVFIQPKSFFTWEAINIGYLSAYLKKHTDIDIDFFSEFFDTNEEIINGCKDADIIGFSVTSPQFTGALKLAKQIKTKDNWIVFGGFHPTNMKHIVKQDCIDSIVIGEGEQAMLEICLGNRDPIVKCDYIQDLDTIPFVDRDVIKQKRNLDVCEKKFGQRIASLLMGRGCPFNCVFCASKSVWGQKTRLRSPENIMEEFLKVTKDYNIDFVNFSDDEIGVDKKHLIEFCELKRKSRNKVKWGCNAVASFVDKKIIKEMKSAGCSEIWLGVESGSSEILKDIKKPNSINQIKNAFRITAEQNLKRRAYCILGMPEESLDTIKMTEGLLDDIKPDVVGFTIVAPYPGTKFYKGYMKYMDWSNVDEYTNDMTFTKYLTNDQLKAEQKRLTDKYSKNLAYRNTI